MGLLPESMSDYDVYLVDLIYDIHSTHIDGNIFYSSRNDETRYTSSRNGRENNMLAPQNSLDRA